jgi:integrase
LCGILPALTAWLQPFAKSSGPLAIVNFQKRHREFFRAAGFAKWKVNGLRHSFATYHLAKWQNAAALAEEMGNSVGIIREHYRNLALPKDAELYWNIQPEQPENIVAIA